MGAGDLNASTTVLEAQYAGGRVIEVGPIR
jgi:hypothetical protein